MRNHGVCYNTQVLVTFNILREKSKLNICKRINSKKRSKCVPNFNFNKASNAIVLVLEPKRNFLMMQTQQTNDSKCLLAEGESEEE